MIYAFDAFELDTDRHELRRGGERVELQPKVLGLLLHLLRHRDRVVSRDELFREVWPGAVVSDDALFHALKKARAAVGDDGAAQRVIETVPRVGYRFLLEVEEREHRAEARAPAASAQGPEPAVATSALVGRSGEMAVLRSALRAVLEGSGRIALLSGDAGIGKTRLAREVAHAARAQGAELHEGGAWDGPGAPPFWVWVQILRSYAATWIPDDLRDAAGEGVAEIARLVPALEQRLGVRVPPVRDTDEGRFRQMDAIAGFLVRVARVRPQVLLLEDLHWASAAALQMLAFLAGELARARILVVATCREGEGNPDGTLEAAIAACAQRDVLVRLRLAGLSAAELGELVTPIVGFAPAASVASALHAETGGNPFFARELIQLAIRESADEATLAHALGRRLDTVPSGVRRVLERRLASVSESCRSVVMLSAVVGEVAVAVIARVLGLPRDALANALEEGVATRLLEHEPGAPPGYRFTHALVREAAYAAIPAGERVQLHARVAQALEALHAGRLGPVVPALAHHYGRAALVLDGTQAVDYAKWAGDIATAALAYDEAAAHYEQALAALELLGERADDRQRATLLVSAGFARQNTGDNDAGRRLLAEAASVARRAGDANLLAFAAIGFSELGLGISEAAPVALLDEAISALREGPPFFTVALRAALAVHLSNQPTRHGEALKRVAEAEAVASAAGEPALLGYALTARAAVLRLVPNATPEERLALLERAGPLLRDGGDRTIEMLNWGQIRGAHVELGDIDAAAAANARIEAAAARLRSRLWDYFGAGASVLTATLEGRFGEIETHLLRGLGGGAGQRFVGALRLALLAMLRLHQGRLGELLPVTDRLGPELAELPVARAVQTLVVAESGDAARARAILRDLVRDDCADVVGTESWVLALALLADACTRLEDAEAASILTARLAPRARYCISLANGIYCHGPVSLALGKLAVTTGDWSAAEAHLALARERADALRSPVWEAESLAAQARLHSRRGRRGDRARAAELAAQALALAEPRGMGRVCRQLRALARDA